MELSSEVAERCGKKLREKNNDKDIIETKI